VSSLQQRAEASVSSPSRSKASQQSTPRQESRLHRSGPHRVFYWANHMDPLRLWHVVRLMGKTMGHVLSTASTSNAMAGTTTENGTALAPRGPGARHLGVTCMTRASPSVFERPTLSSCLTVKPITGSSKRSTTLHAGQSGWIVTYFSFSSFPSTWLTCPELGSITCPKTRSIAGRI
jgi:hypothetical protein